MSRRVALIEQFHVRFLLFKFHDATVHILRLGPFITGRQKGESDHEHVNFTITVDRHHSLNHLFHRIRDNGVEGEGNAILIIDESDSRPSGADIESEYSHVCPYLAATMRATRDFLREAVFLWMMRFLAAVSMDL